MSDLLSSSDDQHLLRRVVAQYGAPAYVRRARRVQDVYEQLLERCREQREEWVSMTRMRLGMLLALAGHWSALVPAVVDGSQREVLETLHADLQPRLKVTLRTTSSVRSLRRALGELIESIERFNRRWRGFLETLDLEEVNRLRDGYNRYYLLEKECALSSGRLARAGFRKLPPVTVEEISARFPSLPVPRSAR